MQPFKYKPPRVSTGELRTPIIFYKYQPNDGPEPGEAEKEELYRCWAKVDQVWLRDLELAKSNGTLSDVTLTIRDPMGDFKPSNKHYLSIDDAFYKDKRYNIKAVQPDLQSRGYINIIAGLTE
ncbi:phage head completion protein [Fictibacillus fluitans]|uniref:Head-tail adaptor protein n=1 Tax=Fictibacillus fluitans TaxID=3058422 RepID=A0ABT8HX12_9BACL|nr:head-tail adaptor protein [Fictibacillus sp. NE201]MDN4525325.1 head-tail adaptor protein [Fictibacillus sp. NE201]